MEDPLKEAGITCKGLLSEDEAELKNGAIDSPLSRQSYMRGYRDIYKMWAFSIADDRFRRACKMNHKNCFNEFSCCPDLYRT